MHDSLTATRSCASSPALVDFDLIEPFLCSVAKHLHTIRPHRREGAIKRITRLIEIELGFVEIEVAIGADIPASCVSLNH